MKNPIYSIYVYIWRTNTPCEIPVDNFICRSDIVRLRVHEMNHLLQNRIHAGLEDDGWVGETTIVLVPDGFLVFRRRANMEEEIIFLNICKNACGYHLFGLICQYFVYMDKMKTDSINIK